jgi:hypothetical protein
MGSTSNYAKLVKLYNVMLIFYWKMYIFEFNFAHNGYSKQKHDDTAKLALMLQSHGVIRRYQCKSAVIFITHWYINGQAAKL